MRAVWSKGQRRTRPQDTSSALCESRNGRHRAVNKNSPLYRIALPTSAQHAMTSHHRCLSRNQQTQAQASSIPESIVNNPKLPVLQSASTSAPADDSASAATSSQRWQSRNRLARHTSLNVRGSHADAQGDNRRLRQSNLRDLWRGQPSRRSGGI